VRILLINQLFVSPHYPGGTRHYEFARYCVKHGDEFTIIASTVDYLTGSAAVEPGRRSVEENVDGVRVLRVYAHPAVHRSFVWRVLCFLSFMVTSLWAAVRSGPADAVMGTSPPIFQAVSAWLTAALRRRPFLLEIRDLWPEFAVEMGVLRNPLVIAMSRWLEGFLYRRATHLLVNSPAYRDYLVGRKVPPAKVTLIANGVDIAMFEPDASGDRVRHEWGLDGKFVVTYAGALGAANDIPTILHAAARLHGRADAHFLLVGDGKERASLEGMARELELANVTFTGGRPKSEMSDYLAASDACVATLKDIPMFRTTYPNKIFDYMAAGRPIVLGIDGVIRQVVEAARCGLFVPPGDAAAMAAAVERLAQDREAARAMGRAGRAYVAQYFNREHQAQAFCLLLQGLTEGKPAG